MFVSAVVGFRNISVSILVGFRIYILLYIVPKNVSAF